MNIVAIKVMQTRIVRWSKLSRSTENTFRDDVSTELFSLPINAYEESLAHQGPCSNELLVWDYSSALVREHGCVAILLETKCFLITRDDNTTAGNWLRCSR
jgi:hypothetical protein